MAEVELTLAFAEETARSGQRYRKEILTMPKASIAEAIKNMTYINGLHGKETTIIMKSGAKLIPYQTKETIANTTTFTERTLETHHADVQEHFDPEVAYGTMFNESLTVQKINFDITRKICKNIAMDACDGLKETLWRGRYNPNGSSNLDISDGYMTIIGDEKAAGNISIAKGNYFQLGNITPYNVVDKFRIWWRKQDPKFKRQNMNLWIPEQLLEMYEDGYAIKFSTHRYNTEFEQDKLYGTHGRVKLCTAPGMEENEYIFMTPKINTRVGGDGGVDDENFKGSSFEIRRISNPKLVQFYMSTFFGCNFATLDKEYFTCASITSSEVEPLLTWDPEEVNFGEVAVGESLTKTVHISGEALSQTTTVNVTGTGFSCATNSVTAASANASGGVDLSVVFAPASVGDKAGKLLLTNAVDGVDVEIPLSGKGVAGTPRVTTDPTEVQFPATAANSTSTKVVNVKGALLTTGLTVAVVGDSEFTSNKDAITKVEALGADGLDVTITYAPTANGSHAAVLRITSATDGINVMIPLVGATS